jgi:hypothetical protein
MEITEKQILKMYNILQVLLAKFKEQLPLEIVEKIWQLFQEIEDQQSDDLINF